MTIKGSIKYVDLSGGFWGIEGDDGQNYQPLDPLPDPLCKEGLRIQAEGKIEDVMSIFMWGETFRIYKITRL